MDDNKELLEGFNTGYLIGKYKTPLAKQLSAGFDGVDTPFFEGFVEGSNASIKEKAQSKFLDQIRNDFGKDSPFKSKDKGRDDKGLDIDK